jgi:hypothetical protein
MPNSWLTFRAQYIGESLSEANPPRAQLADALSD